MGGLSVRPSRDAGPQDEDSRTGKLDEEEDWGRIKYGRGGGEGSSYVEEVMGTTLVDKLKPIAQALSRWRKRKVHWQRPRKVPESTSTTPTVDISSARSAVSHTTDLPLSTSLQSDSTITSATTPTPTPPPLITDTPAIPSVHLTTVVSTISNFPPNGTGGR